MKKTLKIVAWTLLSLLIVVVITISVVTYVVFTPERLTPIVQKEGSKLLSCSSEIERVELTFFSTFPNFGLRIEQVLLINPMLGAPNDTLAAIEYLTASVDLMAYLKEERVALNEFTLYKASVNLYTNAQGVSNFNIIQSSDTTENDTTTTSSLPEFIDLKRIIFKQVQGSYIDETAGLNAALANLEGTIALKMNPSDCDADINLKLQTVDFSMADSLPLYVQMAEIQLDAKAKLVDNQLNTTFKLGVDSLFLKQADAVYVDKMPLKLVANAKANLDNKELQIQDTKLSYGTLQLDILGNVASQHERIYTNLMLKSNSWNIPYLLTLVPADFTEPLQGMEIQGEAMIEAKVQGYYSDSLMPLITAQLILENGTFDADFLPISLTKLNAKLNADIDINSSGISKVKIEELQAKTPESTIAITGTIDDLLGKQYCSLQLNGDLSMHEAELFLPDSMVMTLQGRTVGNLKAQFKLEDLTELRLEKLKANGNFTFTNFAMTTDSMQVNTPELKLALEIPTPQKVLAFKPCLQATMTTSALDATMTNLGHVQLQNATIDAVVSNPLDEKLPLSAIATLKMEHLNGEMDTLTAAINGLMAKVTYLPDPKDKNLQEITLNYFSRSMTAAMGKMASVETKGLKIDADALYNSNETELLMQWNPKLTVDLVEGVIHTAEIPLDLSVPRINFNFSPGYAYINDSRILLGNSDFSLIGEVSNLDEYVRGTGLLLGELQFVSRVTDVNQIMELMNGVGRTDSVVLMESAQDNPFMVPKGMDIALETKIDRAYAGNGEFDNVGGKVTIQDGILILEQMGFTSKAAEMQLTAMYRSDRMNHLFAGVDFHLLNIDVAELINLIPDIDTIVPMLKAFDGKAEFHLAAETYLKSNYDIKMSTLRGAAAIEGQNLVLLDNETFSTISKYMMFNKQTRNKVDTMSIEMTVFRNEVDVYPFLIVMDKYRAIISGRHNLDMTFDYNLSAISPIRLGLEVKGNPDNLKYKLTKAENKTLFMPEKRNAVEAQTMRLKQMISDSLKANVKKKE